MDDEMKMGLRERPFNLLTVPVMDGAMDSGASADGFVHAVADPTIIHARVLLQLHTRPAGIKLIF